MKSAGVAVALLALSCAVLVSARCSGGIPQCQSLAHAQMLQASLEAAVSPASGEELYFVATPQGGHAFSETLEAHLKAVKVWRRYSSSSR